ncbi:energy transducer TonB [Flavobacterium sp. NG2]|uniref:energy transducer TonB n=1 Tax=Flavobacterium sp. NG2 TaxID=3097547 RepID=UPI002A81909B|nr:energy transducer TonB [Flavobacterium sp. NG2]WPR72954.1 energy transducer TonB [Flavobacterium sp. NG2]
MSKSSIYETNWINLVFENRNQEYGAFKLRQETTKTSLMALLVSLSLCAVLFIIPKVLLSFHLIDNSPTETIAPVTPLDEIIEVVQIDLTEKPPVIEANTQPPVQQIITEDVKIESMAHPVIVEASQATQEVPVNSEPVRMTISSEGTGIKGLNPTTSTGATTGTNTSAVTNYGDKVVTTAILDKQPSFPGGIEKFYNYVGRNFETPEINDEKIVRVIVSFIVEKDGSMTDIQVKNDPGYGLGKEAIRVLKSLKTKWSPGIIDSQAVRTAYSLPISVQMY